MLQRSPTLSCRQVLVALTHALCPVAHCRDSGGWVCSRATPKELRRGHSLIRVQARGSSRKKDLALRGGQNLKGIPSGPFCPSSAAPRMMKAPIERAHGETDASKWASREANCKSKFKVVRDNEDSEKQFQIVRPSKSLTQLTRSVTPATALLSIWTTFSARSKTFFLLLLNINVISPAATQRLSGRTSASHGRHSHPQTRMSYQVQQPETLQVG